MPVSSGEKEQEISWSAVKPRRGAAADPSYKLLPGLLYELNPAHWLQFISKKRRDRLNKLPKTYKISLKIF